MRRLCFPFCSVSANVGETSVFNQGPGNRLRRHVCDGDINLRPFGSDLSESSVKSGPALGAFYREGQQRGIVSALCVPERGN